MNKITSKYFKPVPTEYTGRTVIELEPKNSNYKILSWMFTPSTLNDIGSEILDDGTIDPKHSGIVRIFAHKSFKVRIKYTDDSIETFNFTIK